MTVKIVNIDRDTLGDPGCFSDDASSCNVTRATSPAGCGCALVSDIDGFKHFQVRSASVRADEHRCDRNPRSAISAGAS